MKNRVKTVLAWLNSPFVLIILTFAVVSLSADYNPGYGPFAGPGVKIIAGLLLAYTIWRFGVMVWVNLKKKAEPKQPSAGVGAGWNTEGPNHNGPVDSNERLHNGY